jgi:hypothetical protein
MIASEALKPDAVADLVYDAILDGTFWVFTDDRHVENVTNRHAEIAGRRNPTEARAITEDALD